MPVKHIDEETWRLVEKLTVNAIVATKEVIKEGDMLRFLIKRGMIDLNENDYKKVKRR